MTILLGIFLFLVGIICGIGGKLSLDTYAEWKKRQEKTYLDMERILLDWKALEKMKEMDKAAPNSALPNGDALDD